MWGAHPPSLQRPTEPSPQVRELDKASPSEGGESVSLWVDFLITKQRCPALDPKRKKKANSVLGGGPNSSRSRHSSSR